MQKAEGFSRKDVRLGSFRSEIWNGFLFVTFSDDVAPVAELYREMGESLAGWQLGNLEVVAELEWDCAFNWKVIVENFAECYHHLGAHLKTFEPIFPAKTCWSEPEHANFTVAHLPLVPSLADDVRAGTSNLRGSSTSPRSRRSGGSSGTCTSGTPRSCCSPRPTGCSGTAWCPTGRSG